MKNFIATDNERLSKFLLRAYDGSLSYSIFNKLLRKKDIRVNEKRVSKDLIIEKGDNITVYFDGLKHSELVKTVYDDENIMVVVKPKGITSEAFYELLKGERELYFCHRLDRNTDGIMIFAHTETAYKEIVVGFKKRSFTKIYRAEVYGNLEKDTDILQAYLFKDSKKSFVLISDTPKIGYLMIKTAYKVVERRAESTVVDIELLTGRTHQIRAHFAHIGHFVLGDGKYGDNRINKQLSVTQMLLCSVSLTLNFSKDSPLYYLNQKTFSI